MARKRGTTLSEGVPEDAIRHLQRAAYLSRQGDRHWKLDFVYAMKQGIAPGGVALYPAFPRPSYQRIAYEDLIDLKAYPDTLPAVKHTTARQLTLPTLSGGDSASGEAFAGVRSPEGKG